METTLEVGTTTYTSGPIPTPSELAEYEGVVPGLATAIVEQWQKETAHRREQEIRHLDASIGEMKEGRAYALIVVLAAFALSAFIVSSGYPIAGSVVGGGVVLGLATAFLRGRADRQTQAAPTDQASS